MPLKGDDFTVRSQNRRVYVEGSYVKPILLLPGYERLWTFDMKVEAYIIDAPQQK